MGVAQIGSYALSLGILQHTSKVAPYFPEGINNSWFHIDWL